LSRRRRFGRALVYGKVSVEVNVQAAQDVDTIVTKARQMRTMFNDLHVADDKILYKIPCTWQGVEAVRILESEGLACHVTHVYCLEVGKRI
jgi:transaldolase